jgi:hypothetical protein
MPALIFFLLPANFSLLLSFVPLFEKFPVLLHLVFEGSAFGLMLLAKILKGHPFGWVLQFLPVLVC